MLRRLLLLIFTAPAAVGVVIFALGVAPAGALGILAAMLRIYAVLWLLLAIGWGLRHVLRWFFWRVSRRLAFSYFLIGVVPIPLVAVLVAVALYVLAGFFLGHLYRQAADSLQRDVELAARAQLAEFLVSGDTRQQDEELGVSFAYYRSGERIAGERRAPEVWPLDAASGPAIGRSLSDGPPPASSEPSADSAPAADRARPTPARAQRDGTSDRIDPAAGLAPTEILSAAESTVAGELQLFFAGRDDVVSFDPILGGFAARGEWGVAAIFDRPLGTELSRRSGVWSEPKIASDRLDLNVAIEIGDRRMSFDQLEPEAPPEAIRAFFGVSERPSWIDRPFVGWLEIGDEVRSLDGRETGVATAVLVATPRAVVDLLTPQATDAGALGYVTFGVVALLLFDIYLIALVMALFMIFGLSQAVNRLSVAAEKVKEGDFSARIEVRRRDQVGALQRNFNEMAANLEELIADAAQKEIWERELALARELQQSLLPDAVRAPRPLRAATYFRPSTAIGGDYFDLLHLADGRLAVAVADVSGHGLSAGLRMAMVKSALEVLCGEENEPATVLARLHLLLKERLLRVDGG
ncbi:MAG: HAMP domain-containing protein, partial [Acidobacteriota bacterium]